MAEIVAASAAALAAQAHFLATNGMAARLHREPLLSASLAADCHTCGVLILTHPVGSEPQQRARSPARKRAQTAPVLRTH